MNHTFNIHHAKKYGIHEALLIRHFQFWIMHNFERGKNYIDGKTWTYQTHQEIADHFAYLNPRQVKYALQKLIKSGIVVAKRFNKLKIDKTCWYAFKDEKAFGVDEETLNNFYEGQNCPSKDKIVPPRDKIVPPIPDAKEDIDIKKKNIKKKKAYRENVELTEEEYDKLKDVYGNNTEQALDMLDNYKFTHGKKYANDYGVFKKDGWIYKKFFEPQEAKGSESNIDFAKKVEKKHPSRVKAYNATIELITSNQAKVISYTEHGFKDQVINQLRKMGLSIEGL